MIKKQLSFSGMISAGWSKDRIKKYCCIESDERYNKIVACIERIHAGVRL